MYVNLLCYNLILFIFNGFNKKYLTILYKNK